MMVRNLQKNKACPAKPERSRGFVILFAVTIAAILLAIAIGVVNIALKEVEFGTSAKDTNEAFFAADTGIEDVLFADKNPSNYPSPAGAITTSTVYVYGLGNGNPGKNCAVVTVTKDNIVPPVKTTFISKGYNLGGDNPGCTSSNPNRVERELVVSYGSGSATPPLPPVVFNNNSFEAPAVGSSYQYGPSSAGWNFLSAGVQGNGSAWGAANAPDGTQTAFIQNLGSISQAVNMNAGSYTLSFQVARRTSQLQPIKVSIDGTQIGGLISPSGNNFEQVNIPVTINSTGSHTLQMAGTDGTSDLSTFVDIVTMTGN